MWTGPEGARPPRPTVSSLLVAGAYGLVGACWPRCVLSHLCPGWDAAAAAVSCGDRVMRRATPRDDDDDDDDDEYWPCSISTTAVVISGGRLKEGA